MVFAEAGSDAGGSGAIFSASEFPGPASVSWGVVPEVGNDVRLSVKKDVLEVDRLEQWTRDHLIDRIPGSDRAPD